MAWARPTQKEASSTQLLKGRQPAQAPSQVLLILCELATCKSFCWQGNPSNVQTGPLDTRRLLEVTSISHDREEAVVVSKLGLMSQVPQMVAGLYNPTSRRCACVLLSPDISSKGQGEHAPFCLSGHARPES